MAFPDMSPGTGAGTGAETKIISEPTDWTLFIASVQLLFLSVCFFIATMQKYKNNPLFPSPVHLAPRSHDSDSIRPLPGLAPSSQDESSPGSLRSNPLSNIALIPGGAQYAFGNPTSFLTRAQEQLRVAQRKAKRLRRPQWLSYTLQGMGYALLACVVYFFLVGLPLWRGALLKFWDISHSNAEDTKAGAVIFVGIAFVYAVLPLLILFERPIEATEQFTKDNDRKAAETAVIIACYQSAGAIRHTLERVLRTFPAANIFVIANGNSEIPLDHTGDICAELGIQHIWVPIGSKIAAQYVGVAAAHRFRFCLLIDDDVELPEVFPVVTDRIQTNSDPSDRGGHAKIKCIGYTLDATDAEFGIGSLCQQAQNLEYKLAGLSRVFFGRLGTAAFPHGAVSLWERSFLEEAFRRHPGHRISEDWFFGLVCRAAGGRIAFCSQVFVKTAVPQNLIRNGKGTRAGYGEMTVTSQRVWRWNFFLVARILYNIQHIVFDWRLRQYELLNKLDMFQELYGSLLMLFAPFVFPIATVATPQFFLPLFLGVMVFYVVVVVVFNELHLRHRGIQVSRTVVYGYYGVYKAWLVFMNSVSCFTALFNYARYYSVRHPKVTEDERLLQHMLKIVSDGQTESSQQNSQRESQWDSQRNSQRNSQRQSQQLGLAAIASGASPVGQVEQSEKVEDMSVQDTPNQRASFWWHQPGQWPFTS